MVWAVRFPMLHHQLWSFYKLHTSRSMVRPCPMEFRNQSIFWLKFIMTTTTGSWPAQINRHASWSTDVISQLNFWLWLLTTFLRVKKFNSIWILNSFIKHPSLLLMTGHSENCASATLSSIGRTLSSKLIDSPPGHAVQSKRWWLTRLLHKTLNLKFNSTMDTPKTCSQSKPVTMQVTIAGQSEPTPKLNRSAQTVDLRPVVKHYKFLDTALMVLMSPYWSTVLTVLWLKLMLMP